MQQPATAEQSDELRARQQAQVSAHVRWRRSQQLQLLAFFLTVVLVPVFIRNPYHLHVLVCIGIHVIIATGLNLLMGYAGQVSLGYAGFYGIGANSKY